MPDAAIDSGSSISRLNHHFNMLKTQFPQALRSRDAPSKPSSSSSLRSSYFIPRISLRPTSSKSSITDTNTNTSHSQNHNDMGNAKSKLSAARRMHKSASSPNIRHVTRDHADSRAQTAVDNGPAKTSQPQLDHDAPNRGLDAAPRRAAKPALQPPPSEPQLFKTSIFSAKESTYDLYSLVEVSPHEESADGMNSASTPTDPIAPTREDEEHTNGIDIPANRTSMHHVAERRPSISFAPEPFPRRSSIPRSETWGSLTSRHSSVTFADLGFPRRDSQGNSETGSSFGSNVSDGIRKSQSTTTVFVPEPMLRRDSNTSDTESVSLGRKWSISSFRRSRNQSGILPQVDERQQVAESELELTGSRVRASSPPHPRFKKHVGFDNVPNGETTKHNTTSLTLNVRHRGYQARRRSRLFMVGVDEHSYSDYAVQWLLDELVDDGDEIVCVRVIESGVRFNDRQYQADANRVMQNILAKNGSNRAVSFILEYAVGKLHSTFQKLIQMYQPAMLIVGTRGRSLGGIQGLVNNRNSFSKYCLQYSPVPVVVVRPTEKRIKKKVKRANDVNRQTYLGMLAATYGKHEADSEASSTYELEVQISPDEEASQVAKVLGLPAAFDPTIKPVNLSSHLRPRSPAPSSNLRPDSSPKTALLESPGSAANSEEEEEEDGEFEVMSGTEALNEQKLAQLHKMEKGEASALLRGVDDEDEEDDDDHAGVKLTS